MNRSLRSIIILLLGFLILASFPIYMPISYSTISQLPNSTDSDIPNPLDISSSSSVAGSGNTIQSLMTFSRRVENLDIDVINSYANTSSHKAEMNLLEYLVPGWTLYEAEIIAIDITATNEREIVGSRDITPVYNDVFAIREYETGLYYTDLAQGFYNQIYDGQLQSLSILYHSPTYDPGFHNYAYIDIRADYKDGDTNMVSSVPLYDVGYTGTWASVTESAILNANTVYFAVINGTDLNQISGDYPKIRWYFENSTGIFQTLRHKTDGDSWGSDRPYEALLNYTYIPWNTTANSPLEFSDAQSIAMTANSTPLSGFEWLCSSSSNITNIEFSTNQSVNIKYDLELRYKKDTTSTTSWYADTSGSNILWNVTSILDYPEVSGIADRNLTLLVPFDWTAIHLFKESSPSIYDDTFQQNGKVVRCSQLSDATWILECTSSNYIKSMQKYDSSSDCLVIGKVIVSVTLDINSTIESATSMPAVNGDANLRIYHESTLEYSDSSSVSAGTSHHQWDISIHSSTNGLHLIELYWINGTEVGYYTDEIVVYYPTALTAKSYDIDGFTESTVDISVDFEDTFTHIGLEGDSASVVYSFAGESNTSLTDQHNGTWTASISTTGRAPNTYNIEVFAEGYAVENRSLTISTTLIHDTEMLSIQWLDSNNISYIETTELRVAYNRVGSIPIADAEVNVTIDGEVILMHWDSDLSLYILTFNGTDTYSGFKTYNLEINAWKEGHKPQVDTTQQLTIHHEFTIFTIDWSHGTNITYLENTILTVSYQQRSDMTPIALADVNVTDGITTWLLHTNVTDGTYYIIFNGTDSNPGYGTHNLTIQASKFGYEGQENKSCVLTVIRVPTNLEISWSNGDSITYVNSTTLIVNYTMQNGDPVEYGTVNVTVDSEFFILTYNPLTKTYNLVLNGNDPDLGIGIHTVTVLVGKIGYDGKTNDSEYFTIDLAPTTITITWSAGFNITYTQQTTLNVTYLVSNGSPISGAMVNVTINGRLWNLTWDGIKSYLLVFNGSDSPPGLGNFELTICAGKYGYVNQYTSRNLILREETTFIDVEWIDDVSVITYADSTTLFVNYTMSSYAPIEGAVVYATIGTTTWNLTWDDVSKTYRVVFYGTDNPPDLGIHTIIINATCFGFVTAYDSATLTIDTESTTLLVEFSPSNNITYVDGCILYVSYFMNFNDSIIIDAIVYATIAEVQRQMEWDIDLEKYYLYIDGDTDLPSLGTYTVFVEASKYGFDTGLNSTREIILSPKLTSLKVRWANEINAPDFDNYTYLIVEYTYGSSIPIRDAWVNVTIDSHTWDLEWNNDTGYYQLRFNGSDSIPGFGTHLLTVKAWKYGFIGQINSSEEIIIPAIPTKLSISWTNGNTITYVKSTTLQVFYTMYNDSIIYYAMVNVTINGVTLDLDWNNDTHAYERVFYGLDALLGLGYHELNISASSDGFDSATNSIVSLTIIEEATAIYARWSEPYENNITYFEFTFLFVDYLTSNGTAIQGASVNVSIDAKTWTLKWDDSEKAYAIRFNGSDVPPGFGFHTINITASKYGFIFNTNTSMTLNIDKDPTSIEIQWSDGSNISFIASSTLLVYYRMSNTSSISTGIVKARIGVDTWNLTWNPSANAYYFIFNGTMNPPGIGIFNMEIIASGDIFTSQLTITSFEIHEDHALVTPSWTTVSIDWTESLVLDIEYRDSYGRLIDEASQKIITIDGESYTLKGTDGIYSFEFNNTFDLGHHLITVNISKYGYEFGFISSLSINITEAPTSLVLIWNPTTTIDYLGQIQLLANYSCFSTESIVPQVGVKANITIDGSIILPLEISGDFWTISLKGIYLDLGQHSVLIQAQAYGYSLANSSDILTVNEVATNPLSVNWNPTNLTIEYTGSIELVVDYTYYDGDVPNNASVDVTINSHIYILAYSSGAWRTTINAAELDLGIHDAYISAGLYGYAAQTNITYGVNVTPAANWFHAIWQPSDRIASYIDIINISVIYQQDYEPINGSSVILSVNGTLYDLEYSSIDEMWHISIKASSIGLGIWNVTVTANKTGYTDGWYSDYLIIEKAFATLKVNISATSLYYDENSVLDIYYLMDNLSYVPSSSLILTLDGINQTASWVVDHWTITFNGNILEIGVHVVNITVTAFGFEGQSNSTVIAVLLIPTEIIYSTNFTVYASEIFTMRFTYLDSRTSIGIIDATSSIDWIGNFNLLDLENGTYLIEIGGSSLHMGNYSFEITLEMIGHNSGIGNVSIFVLAIQTEFRVTSIVTQYENESIVLEARFVELTSTAPIVGANVIAILEGREYVLIFDIESGNYTITIHLPVNLVHGSYIISISAEALDHESKDETTELNVLAKSQYIVDIDVAQQIRAGENLVISVSVHDNTQPVEGISLTLSITIISEDSTTTVIQEIVTDENGVARVTFMIPSDATNLEIAAKFSGSISSWSAESSIYNVEVISGGSSGLNEFLNNPIILSIIVGSVSIPSLGFLVLRRRRGISREVIESPVASGVETPIPTTMEIGPDEKLKAEITSSDSGLTRAELSKRLGLSAAKIGTMVRDLLTSDPNFHEVREGAKRLIKKKE